MKKILLAPSILSANFCKLGKEVRQVLQFGADIIHFDVMDNHYVPNITFGPLVLESLRNNNIVHPIEVHLMVHPVTKILIKNFIDVGATTIIVHPETTYDLNNIINFIKSFGCKVGLALSPNIEINYLYPFLDIIDIVLVMSVMPGFGGQKFLLEIFQKISCIRKLLNEQKNTILLEVDGGVTLQNVKKIVTVGADIVVLGTSLLGTNDYQKTLKNFD